jgi:hypothetical protein
MPTSPGVLAECFKLDGGQAGKTTVLALDGIAGDQPLSIIRLLLKAISLLFSEDRLSEAGKYGAAVDLFRRYFTKHQKWEAKTILLNEIEVSPLFSATDKLELDRAAEFAFRQE